MFSIVYTMSKPPAYYKKETEELNKRFSISIDEMTRTFPFHKAYPNVPSMQNEYQFDSGQFNRVQADFFTLKDGLQKDIDALAKQIASVDKDLSRFEKENAKMMVQLSSLDNKKQGAIGMFEDTRESYDLEYLKNVIFGAGVIGLGVYAYRHRQ
jgi:septal ring factor EnvC (AmiA/AmiB activator)